ncbi:nuclear intron maturase 4 [Citrus sinensis]|nr:nuclear intron maturase 4 [Citrus sinensis]
MQDIKAKAAESEELILSEYIAEQALPQELRESFYEFQKHVEEYVSSETVATLSLLLNSCSSAKSVPVTKTVASVNAIKKHLLRQIIDWFSGVVRHWCAWYRECDNFSEIKQLISNELRIWCIRTLAAKYRIREKEIGNRFDSEPSRIPLTQETELEVADETAEAFTANEALIYRFPYNGLCLLSLARMVSQSWPCNCFVFGRSEAAPSVYYTLHVMERQRFPGWKTGSQVEFFLV